MSYESRLGEDIKFTSPSGREFTALWRGNDVTKSKKLGIFPLPKRKGSIVQDFDVAATRYPISFFFDGENHDLISRLFFETCSESGPWSIVHPTVGKLTLQLVIITRKDQPIKNASFTEMESEWIEPLDEDAVVSSAELAAQIEERINQINQATADQLNEVSDQTTASRIQALKDAASSAMSVITSGLETISELSAAIADVTNAIQRATTTNLTNPLIAINSLATQFQVAAQTPALATENVTERISSYSNVLTTTLAINPEIPTPENKNALAIKEIAATSLLATLPRIITTGDLKTRQEAVNLAEILSDALDTVTSNLDANQELYSDNLLENQYFSQSQSYSDMVVLIGLGIEYLLRTSLTLKVEKRFTLEKARAPIEITITEYGELGDNDSNYDLFIESNKLKNNEILLLEAGREVLLYV